MTKSLDHLTALVVGWGEARKIIPNAKPHTQLLKTVAELGELADAENKGDLAGVIDGIGDVLVTLVLYAELKGLTLNQCLEAAYMEIKDRKGTLTPEGLFIKE